MSFAITDSTNVTVKNWSVIQPQFWASIVINSTNVLYRDYYVNATNTNAESNGHFLNWIQNTDGCDTYKSHNVTFGKYFIRRHTQPLQISDTLFPPY
jgi:galacturan 1,4-alpha-galacturonidase